MKHSGLILFLVLSLAVAVPAWANQCQAVGGVLMTNIGVIHGSAIDIATNLGPVFGDLQGSVAATIMGQDTKGNFLVQHYWVNAAGETILFNVATLKPVTTTDPNVVPVLWGNYRSYIARHRQVQECHWLPRLLRDCRFPREHLGAALQRKGLPLDRSLRRSPVTNATWTFSTGNILWRRKK